jgi:GTP-binding protein
MLTIAIVGRPNVGKSTLFNRLVGKRVAITMEMPGTTRDRIIQQGEWLGRRYWAIDTGGLVPSSDEAIMKEIEIQVELALAESDVALLLVDGSEGLNPLDIEIAHRLQRRKKEFLLVVNKIDRSTKYEVRSTNVRTSDFGVRSSFAEFYKLGVKELFPISAEHGTGVDDVLDRAFALFPEPPESGEPMSDIRLVILGRPNVGKSSFLNALLGTYRAIVHEEPGTTRDSIEATFNFEDCNYRIVDTAGIRRKSRVEAAVEYFSVIRAIRNIDDADVALLVIDVRAGIAVQDKRIAAIVAEKGKGLVIVANKSDLITSDAVKPVRDWLRDAVPYISHVPIVFTSALTKEGVQDAVRQARRVFAAGGARLTNDQLKNILMPSFQATPPRRGAVISGVKQRHTRPPIFILQTSDTKAVNDAYLKFAEKEIRRHFGFDGYPVRVRVTGK